MSDLLYKKGPISIKLDDLDMEALLEILVFAKQAASFLAQNEKTAGRTGKELTRLTRITADSQDFITFLTAHIQIGEPSHDSLN